MARHVFYSFHYDNDFWRTWQVRQMGAIEGQRVAHANEWETIRRSPEGVRRWIDAEMRGKTCVVVLIGSETASRPWVDYEIRKGWTDGKGVLGINIHGLKCDNSLTCAMGANPFAKIEMQNGRRLSEHVPVLNPAGWDSKQVYGTIAANIEGWIDQAIAIRRQFQRAA
jgi:hypothetical protein